MRNVSKLTEGQGRDRVLSQEEKTRLLEECTNSRNPNLFPIVSLALMTGMRHGEIVGLRWKEIDFVNRTVTLNQTKNGDRRVIPLTGEMEQIFKNCWTYGEEKERLIFRSTKDIVDEKRASIREAFENALHRAGITNFRFHDLRHTAASYMAMAGATQGELMTILGHRSPSMTRRYAHYSQQHLLKLMDRVRQFNEAEGVRNVL
jgi:integrase